MSDAWWFIAGLGTAAIVWALVRGAERVWRRKHPPRDTSELLNRIASVAHPLIEARLTCAWHEAELAKITDNVPPVFEDQVMLAAQLGQAIEQSVMREVQRQGVPIVRLSGQRESGYSGWMSKWLRRASDDVSEKPIITVPDDPQLPARGMASPSMPPPSSVSPSRAPLTIVPPPPGVPGSSSGPQLIFRNGSWVPRKSAS